MRETVGGPCFIGWCQKACPMTPAESGEEAQSSGNGFIGPCFTHTIGIPRKRKRFWPVTDYKCCLFHFLKSLNREFLVSQGPKKETASLPLLNINCEVGSPLASLLVRLQGSSAPYSSVRTSAACRCSQCPHVTTASSSWYLT